MKASRPWFFDTEEGLIYQEQSLVECLPSETSSLLQSQKSNDSKAMGNGMREKTPSTSSLPPTTESLFSLLWIVQKESYKLNMRLKFLNAEHQNQSERLRNWTEISLKSLKSNRNGGLTNNFLIKIIQSFCGYISSFCNQLN